MNWLVFSILASVMLTVLLNVAPRLFPRAGHRANRRAWTWAAPDDRFDPSVQQRRVRVLFPWKAMLVGSLVLTVVVNALIRLG